MSGLDTGNVTGMSAMFTECTSLEKIKGLAHLLQGSATNIPEFRNCMSLKRLDLGEWNTSNVKSLSLPFYLCGNIEYVDMTGDNIRFPNLTRVYRFSVGLADGCQLKLGKNFFDAPNITEFGLNEFKWEKTSMVLSLVKNLFDRKSAGQADMTLELANNKNNLTEDEIAAITAKGYIIA